MFNYLTEQPTLAIEYPIRRNHKQEEDPIGIIEVQLPCDENSLDMINSVIPDFDAERIILTTRSEYMGILSHIPRGNQRISTKFRFFRNASQGQPNTLLIEQTGPDDVSNIDPTPSMDITLYSLTGDLLKREGVYYFHMERMNPGFRSLTTEGQTIILGLIDDIVKKMDYGTHSNPLWFKPY